MGLQLDPCQIELLTRQARAALSPRRYLHVLGVTHTAVTLALLHGVDPAQAALAGLLHDIVKSAPPELAQRELAALGHPLAPEDLPHPRTWHGLHAAALGPVRFGITDPAVLHAVAMHTTGDAVMPPLALILFLSDFCEPNRKIDEAPEVRELARHDLQAAFRRAFDLKTRHMLANKPGFQIHARALRALHAWLPAEARKFETVPAAR